MGGKKTPWEDELNVDEEPAEESLVLREAVLAARDWALALGQESQRGAGRHDLMDKALGGVMSFGETLARAQHKCLSPLSPAEIIAGFFESLSDTVANAPEEPLLVGDPSEPQLSEFAESLLEWADEDPLVEILDNAFSALRVRLSDIQKERGSEAAQALYDRFRRTLIVKPLLEKRPMVQWANALELRWSVFYEPIPPSCLTGPQHHRAWECNTCHWTLTRVTTQRLGCQNPECRSQRHLYDILEDGDLRPLRGDRPKEIRGDRFFRINSLVRRRYQLPGLDEQRLKSLIIGADPSFEVELWPELDAYDLRISCGEREWRVDVKSWRSGRSLAAHLAETPPKDGVLIALPDRLSRQVEEAKRSRPPKVDVYSFSEILGLISGGGS